MACLIKPADVFYLCNNIESIGRYVSSNVALPRRETIDLLQNLRYSYREIHSRTNRNIAERFTFKVHNGGGKIRAISLNNVIRSGSADDGYNYNSVCFTLVFPSYYLALIAVAVVFIILIIVSYARRRSSH